MPIVILAVLSIVGIILWALYVGLRAARLGYGRTGAQQATLYLLALFLIEPSINTVVVGAQVWARIPNQLANAHELALITVPIAVLLIPALGLALADSRLRMICASMLGLGLLRWLVCYATLACVFFEPDILGIDTAVLGGGLLLGGCLLLCGCAL